MDDSPFRRIVLPALLASSAGFTILTWPMASDSAGRVAERLPDPLGRWVNSALITPQHKEFSIRYIGFAILSSVAIGIGTAEVMRSRQAKVQRYQGLLDEVLTKTERSHPLADKTDFAIAASQVGDEALIAEQKAAADQGVAIGDRSVPTLDWASLLQAPPVATEGAAVEGEQLPTHIDDQSLYHLQSEVDQRRCLAVGVAGRYYRYYRHRPDLAKARSLVQRLQQRGQRSITTRDDTGYVVWVYQPNATPALPWPELVSSG